MVRSILDWHLPYYLPTLLGLVFVFSTEFLHQSIIHLWIDYVLLPVLDIFVPEDNTNPTPEEEKILKKQFRWNLPIIAYVVFEWAAFFWVFSYIQKTDLSFLQLFLVGVSYAHVNAEGILVSHELFHRKNIFWQLIGTLNLIKSLYMHFYLEHVYGHHKYVSTPEDPATAKLNQTLSDFTKQSIKGGLLNSWNREANRLKKQQKSVYSTENKMIQFTAAEVIFLLLVFYFYGFKILLFFVGQAFLSTSMLEAINYVRHYGLVREKMENGEYEPVTTKHSWNAPQLIQNYALFKLQRHSDHHAHAHKPYQILHSAKDAPSLPCGYSICLLACQFPSFWFGIINPLVESTNKDGKPTEKQMKSSSKVLMRFMAYEVFAVSFVTGIVLFWF